MIFSPDMLEKVLNGTKTQTRRPVKQGQHPEFTWIDLLTSDAVIGGVLFDNLRTKWRVGSTYAVCPGRGQKSVGRIRILAISRERPCNISEDDARAEGFDTRESFWDKLRSLYGDKVDLNKPYWAITFELVKE